MEEANRFKTEFLENHLKYKKEVDSFYQLMRGEIEQGESIYNEIELFIGACNDLLIKK